MKNKKGQAGLGLFLSVIAMLFVTGIIVMAFALASAQIMQTPSAFDRTSAANVNNESQYMNGSIDYFDLDQSTLRNVICSITGLDNGTITIGTGNYSTSNCRVTQVGTTYENVTWYANYTYTYETPNQVSDVINETQVAISSATDWFAIFITIAAVVVLILLIVLIVISLRGAGLMGGSQPGA